jgi:hypothetical protein
MSLPDAVQALWNTLQEVRAEVLAEAEGLSQAQSEWRPDATEWSVGEVIHHLTIAEIATGKLTTKLTREADATGRLAPLPSDLREFAPLPSWPPGPMEAMKATRERSRQSIEKLGSVDPRKLVFKHFRLGDLDLGQWWCLQGQHDGIHLGQIRAIKSAPGFP